MTRAATRRESEGLRAESSENRPRNDVELLTEPTTEVTASVADETIDYEYPSPAEGSEERKNEQEEIPLNESMIEFRETCSIQLNRLREIGDAMDVGIRQLEVNTARICAENAADQTSDSDDEIQFRDRSSTPTLVDVDRHLGRKRTPSPDFSDISSIAAYEPAPLAPIGYSQEEEDQLERERREARTRDFVFQNQQADLRERQEQERSLRQKENEILQRIAEVDEARQKYHNERCHTLGTIGQALAISERQTQQLQRVNMLTNRATASRKTQAGDGKKSNRDKVKSSKVKREHTVVHDLPTTNGLRDMNIRASGSRPVRPSTLDVPRPPGATNRTRAIAPWPLDPSLVVPAGSTYHDTTVVTELGSRRERTREHRRRQRAGQGPPSDSSGDSSEEDSSSDEGGRYNEPRQRYNRYTRRVELKPNCFNGKNWPSYRLHFLSCVEGNGWSKKLAVKVLKTKLVDDAAYVLQQRQNGVWSLKGLLGALDCRYSQVGGPNYLIRQALHYAHQENAETLQHYVDRIMGIVWGKLNDQELEDQLALDQFLVGVSDPELQQFLGEQPRMRSLFDALKMARDWELSEQHTQARKATIKLGKDTASNTAANRNSDSDERVILMRQLDKEKERNRQLQINAEVDRRLRQQEVPRADIRNQNVRFDNQSRPAPSQQREGFQQQQQNQYHQPSQQQHQHQQYNRPPAQRGGYSAGRGGYRNNQPPSYNQQYQQGPPAGGPRQFHQQDDRRGPPPGQAQGPPPPNQSENQQQQRA